MSLPHLERCQTLLDAMRSVPPERPCVTMWRPDREPEHETVRFGEFSELAGRFASVLRDSGLAPGETVLLIHPQGVPLMAGFVGAMMIGAIPSILAYPNFKVDPKKYRDGLAGVTRNLAAKLTVVDESFPDPLLKLIQGRNVLALGRGQAMQAPPLEPRFQPAPTEIAFLQHSAGTTGLQKGVALTHQQVLRQIRKLAEALSLTRHDRIASWLPLYHDMGLIACFMLPLVVGLHVVTQSPIDWVMQPDSFLRLIDRFRCTLAWLPNFAFQFLARKAAPGRRPPVDLSSMRAFVSCSEPIRHQSLEEFRTAFQSAGLRPTALQTSYAMAENVFAATQSRPAGGPGVIWIDGDQLRSQGIVGTVAADHPKATPLVSSGRVLESVRALVVDERGRELPDGRVGEIALESDCLFEGYFNRPDLTRRALRNGRYFTGDRGFSLAGELYVLGRVDDTLIIAGRNFDPQDVEEIAHAHPEIADGRAVAFAIENPALGTRDLFVAAEAASPESLAEGRRVAAEIRQAIVAELDVAPREVRVVPPRWLVKSTAGKPARSANREKFEREFLGAGTDSSP